MSDAANTALPTPRLPSLDFIRGVCVLLMLPATIPWFSRPFTFWDAHPQPAWEPDRIVVAVNLFFLDHKVLTLFALLFGMGFGLQMRQLGGNAKPMVAATTWRMGILFLLGLLHAALLNWADLLGIYAIVGIHVVGIVLLGDWVERLSFYTCFVWFYFCIVVITFLSIVPLTDLGGPDLTMPPSKEPAEGPPVSLFRGSNSFDEKLPIYLERDHQLRIGREGSFVDVLENRLLLHIKEWLAAIILYGWYMLGCALLGVRYVRAGLLDKDDVRRRLSRRFLLVGAVIGVPFHLGAVAAYLAHDDSLSWCLSQFGALPLALLYLALLLAVGNAGWFCRLQSCLRAVGRMSLSNYLLQSLLYVVLFYPYGFGLFGLPLTAALAVAAGTALFQLLASPLWLRVFQMGPAEWLWRCLAERRFRPLLRAAAAV